MYYVPIRNVKKQHLLSDHRVKDRDSTLQSLKRFWKAKRVSLIVYECAVRTAWNNDHYAVNAPCKLPQLARSKIIYAAYLESRDERKRILRRFNPGPRKFHVGE